jgi:hypothetical protein
VSCPSGCWWRWPGSPSSWSRAGQSLEQRKQQLAAEIARQQSKVDALERELVEKGGALRGKPGV